MCLPARSNGRVLLCHGSRDAAGGSEALGSAQVRRRDAAEPKNRTFDQPQVRRFFVAARSLSETFFCSPHLELENQTAAVFSYLLEFCCRGGGGGECVEAIRCVFMVREIGFIWN